MNISESELVVLQILWQSSPLTIGQIIARIPESKDWHDNTIKTLTGRLLKKGHISRQKDGRQYFYSPNTSKEDVLTSATKSFMQKFFDGQVGPLIAHFAAHKSLQKSDIEAIDEIIKELKND